MGTTSPSVATCGRSPRRPVSRCSPSPGSSDRSEVVERAVGYLQESLPSTRAPQSLCWGVLGLRAWGCCPEAADDWLARAFEQTLRRRDSSPRPAHLLLAAGERSLELLGLAPERRPRHEG